MSRAMIGTLAVAVVLAASLPARADDLVVRLVDNRFEPADVVLEHGKTYRLRFENRGKELHEFKAKAFFDAAKVGDRGVLSADGSEIVLQPGQSKELELTAPAAGSYALTCPDHDWDGMIGTISVR